MRNTNRPRQINVSRAKHASRRPSSSSGTRKAYDQAVYQPVHRSSGSRVSSSSTASSRQRSVQSTRSTAHAVDPHAPVTSRRRKKKRSTGKKVLAAFLVVLLITAGALGAFYWYVADSLKPEVSGSLTEEIATPPEYGKDLTNILVLGIDYDDNPEEEALGVQRSKNGNTDMILYVQFNKKENTVHMLQIPRDTYVGLDLPTGGTGRINALYAHGEDQENRVQNLAQVLYDQLKLPVDDYVVIDMQMLKGMMTALGDQFALEVYVPVTMEYNGSRLEQGYHWLQGEELEFFLRQRKDASATPRGDLDRLNNQRYFYAALFKYMLTMSWQEMVKLMPVFLQYVETDISPLDCAALGVAALNVPAENILMGRLPVYGTQVKADGSNWVSGIAIQETADFLNEYFRPADAPVSADELNIQLPAPVSEMGAVVDPEMSQMGTDGTVADYDETQDTSGGTSVQPAA
ncbi:LCP family protein [uncultured Ruthenibacterium sp.]|uniref:LCP family protein n=1 Tax=uncultured Ruthenibacterium sp. TaxID=1905347 RepID=UPI00349EFA0D